MPTSPDVIAGARKAYHVPAGRPVLCLRAKTESFPPSLTKLLQITIYGGGGNRTRVRGRTEQSVYERSPCFISPAGRFTDNLPTGQPSWSVALRAIGTPSAPSPISGADSGSRAQPGSTSPDLASTRRRVRVRSCSHLLWCRLIYEANRRPRLATLPENRPRRNLIAPVCVLRV